MIWNAFTIALREIRRNLTRAFLTVLGVIIGVSAFVTMVTLGEGTTAAIREQISGLGSNLLVLHPGAGFGARRAGPSPNFTEEDAELLKEQVSGIAMVAPVRSSSMTTAYSYNARSTAITGSLPEYFPINKWEIESGRLFSDEDVRSGAAVAVIGQTVKKELFGSDDPVGSKMRLGSVAVEVVGVLKGKGQAGMGDQDDTIIVPLSTIQRRLLGKSTQHDINRIVISAEDGVDADLLIDDINAYMRDRRNLKANQLNNFNVFDTRQIAETMSSSTQVMTMLLAAVACISLLVGGIGIMNIMLVSVTERTREIGIRLSLGGTSKEVLLQFLVEAITLSCVGGVVGLLLSFGFCSILSGVIDVPFLFNTKINMIAFGFSAVVGILFGFAPARRAARLDPIDALRHE